MDETNQSGDAARKEQKPVEPIWPEDISFAPAPRPPVDFTAWDALALVLALGLSVLWFYVFSFFKLFWVPAWGTTAFVLAALLAETVCLRGRVRPSRQGIFLLSATVLIAVSCAIFPDYALRLINLALLSFLTPASALALAGRGFPAMSVRVISETVRLFIPNLFRHFIKPFQAMRRGGRKFNGLWVVLLTLLIILPALALILALLSSADLIFSSILGDIGDGLIRAMTHAGTVWRVVRTVVMTLLLFSFLYSLSRPVKPAGGGISGPSPLPQLAFIAALSALDIIYAVFAVIQVIFLFGGAETALMHGGYAEYARSGFFQLVAVAAINLTAAMFSAGKAGRNSRAVRILTYILIALTAVILASALMRMCLYIGAFGLSILRAMTLLIMAWLAAALIAASLKTARPDIKVFPALFALALTGWIVFNYVNIDRCVARFNYDAYVSGRLTRYDYEYLVSLGPEAGESLPLPCRPLIPNDPPKIDPIP